MHTRAELGKTTENSSVSTGGLVGRSDDRGLVGASDGGAVAVVGRGEEDGREGEASVLMDEAWTL